ncbi:FadR/GntR family transcriptional regulator [Raineyella fluvialis]|uniref:FCD domain-containing protein n=1 Tax=Raineyella fluvialis TaxID=2662261 RepID=A0A5Q2FAT4_9ACTN|nr:FCD domain-containing protein [Raineyella fluvialis]QGF23501.1 FCD domain-containing protein [Raineyella fluvialis]
MATTSERPLMHHGVARELGIEIIEGRWPVNQARTLEDIQDRFGVSRTVAREASRLLEMLGLASTQRRRGIVALEADSWHVLDTTLIEWRLHSNRRREQLESLTQLRLAVEPVAVDGMARTASIHDRALLLPLAAEMRRTGEGGLAQEFLRLDVEFHRLILTNSGNELFAALSDQVASVLAGRSEIGLMPVHPQPTALDAHEAVAEAVFRGDGPAARVAMQVILDEVQAAVSDVNGRDAAASAAGR